MYEKWHEVEALVADISNEFAHEAIEIALKYAQKSENFDMEGKIKSLKSTNIDLENNLKSKCTESAEKHEKAYIKSQTAAFQRWNLLRESELEAQHKRNFETAKLQEIEQEKVKLEEEEKRLFFFENYNEMEFEKRKRWLKHTKTFPKATGKDYGKPIRFGKSDIPYTTRAERKALKNRK